MRRRKFIALLGGTAATWPLPTRAQQSGQMRRIGVLMVVAENDPDAKRFVAALENQLEAEGWHKGRNLEITYRWGASNPERLAQYANELVLAAPDVLVTLGTAALLPMKKAATSIPVVFTVVSDPVAQGFVTSLAHPGGNMTGFSNYEPDIGRRWLQLLKEVAPSILKGEKPAELPVQGPTRYTMTINLKTAKAFGLTVVSGLIASADEVIE